VSNLKSFESGGKPGVLGESIFDGYNLSLNASKVNTSLVCRTEESGGEEREKVSQHFSNGETLP